MTDDSVALMEALQRADDGNLLRSLAWTVLQTLMEADVQGVIGAGRCERSGERNPPKNGLCKRDRPRMTESIMSLVAAGHPGADSCPRPGLPVRPG